MEGSFPFLEIVLFAMVAGFLILRLRSVLGRRTGNERRRPDPISARTPNEESRERDTVVPLPERPRAVVDRGEAGASVANSGALAGIAQIRSIDLADFSVLLPVFLTVTVMPLTYSIANGIGAGFIGWVVVPPLVAEAWQVWAAAPSLASRSTQLIDR